MKDARSTSELQGDLRCLIDSGASEQDLQAYLESHTQFIPRQFVQHHGIAHDLVLSKLHFGQDLVSDFAFVSGSSDDWWIVLIELERPQAKFFKAPKGKPEIHGDFRRGLDQIARWRGWLTNPANLEHLYSHQLIPLVQSHFHRKKLVKYVLVTGRRSMYEGNPALESLVTAQERDDFEIMTWDALVDHPAKKEALYVGKRRDGYIDIITPELLSDRLFGWIEARGVRLNQTLRSAAERHATRGVTLPRSVDELQIRWEDLEKMGTWD